MQPYEIIDHTSEIGIRAYGRSREELFSHMAMGMFSLIASPEHVQPKDSISIQANAEDWEELLVAWLRELLYLFSTRNFLGKSFQIHRLEPTRVEATVCGEPLDERRHSPDREVKAVTYCDLKIDKTADGLWSAQVIFDI